MQVDINRVEEIRQDINQNIPNTLNDISSKISEIKANLPRSVANKKMNDYKLYNLNRKVKNINEDVNKITSLLYKAVSGMRDAENKIAKMLSSINLATVGTSLSTNSKISSWDAVLASKNKVNQWFEDTGAEIIKWFTTKTSGIPNIFQKLKDTGAKIKSAFKREDRTEVLSVADKSFDEGIFEKTTLCDNNGNRIEYDHREKCDDGSIKYYDKYNHLIKEIKADGSVVVMTEAGSIYMKCTQYFPDGTYIETIEGDGYDGEGRVTYYDKDGQAYKRENYGRLFLDKIDEAKVYTTEILEGDRWKVYKDGSLIQEKLVDSNGYINYYENGNKKSELLEDGTYNNYYENGQLMDSSNIDKGNSSKYSENGTLTYQKQDGKVVYELYSDGRKKIETVNGVYREYTPDGVIKKEVYSDGSYRKYNNYYTKDDVLYKSVVSNGNYKLYANEDLTTYKEYTSNGTLVGEFNGDGTNKSYYPNGNLQFENKGNGVTKSYTKDGRLYKETLADGTYKEYRVDGTTYVRKSNGSDQLYAADGRAYTKVDNGWVLK